MNNFDIIGPDIFRQEASELLQSIEKGLMQLESDPENTELLGALFRDLHTIKGSGAMFGFVTLSKFAHEFENAFDDLRKGRAVVTPDLISLSLKACDQIEKLMHAADTEADAPENVDILNALRKVMGHEAPDEPETSESVPFELFDTTPETVATVVRFWLAPQALRMGSNPALLIDELCGYGPATVKALDDRIPEMTSLDPLDCLMGWEVKVEADLTDDQINQVFMFVQPDMELQVQRLGKPDVEPDEPLILPQIPAATETTESASPFAMGQRGTVPDDKPEPVMASPFGMGVRGAGPKAPVTPQARPTAPQLPRTPSAPMPPNGLTSLLAPGLNSAQPGVGESMRVTTQRLNELMDQVGELVIAETRLRALAQETKNPDMQTVAEDIQRLVAGLQSSAMSMRMVPISGLMGRFRRLIRDLSTSLGKPIHLETVGEDTELDKTVFEHLSDLLVHILRNAADHGLEMPHERKAAGKPETGTIVLTAQSRGTEIQITIRDDGRGIDLNKVRNRAENVGLIKKGADLSDDDILRLIFEPGFSTAEQVSETSGRGVGMDVVKRTISSMRGKVDISSELGVGTTMSIHLPLTLAIVDGVEVEVGDETYIFPLAAVSECVELPSDTAAHQRRSSNMEIRGELVPLLHLRNLFSVPGNAPELEKVVVIAMPEGPVGIVVDRITGNHQTVIKQMPPLHAHLKVFSGVTVLSTGRVALIIEPNLLTTLAPNEAPRMTKEAAA